MNRKIFVISVIVFVVDQITKNVLAAILVLNKDIVIIKNFFYVTLTNNYGVAWSMLPYRLTLIIIGTILALILIYRYMYSFQMNKRNTIAFGLLTGGILGNFIDRILQGYVIDFLNFYMWGLGFPIFNIADIAIVIGIFLLIIAVLKEEDKNDYNSK